MQLRYVTGFPSFPIDSIMRLMTVWTITGKIIRTINYFNYICIRIVEFLQFVFCVSVKVKLTVLLLCVCAILPGKAIPEMTYTVLGGTLNPTHSLTMWQDLLCYIHWHQRFCLSHGVNYRFFLCCLSNSLFVVNVNLHILMSFVHSNCGPAF